MNTKKLASLIIKISANSAQAQSELKTLQAKVEDFGKSMQRVGANMTKYVTVPLTAIAGLSVKAANTQLQAEARLLTALKKREDVQQRLIAQASDIQQRSVYGDEEIIEQQAYLAALGLTEEQISATTEAAVQLSAAMGMELESAVRNLAKTYSGMTGELGESLPALRELTEEQLKSGEAIRYVNEEYQGFAESVAKTGAGPLQQLKNKIGDLAEKIGTALLPIVTKLAEWLGVLVDWFNNLSPATQEIIAYVAAFAAALGPLLALMGKLVAILPVITTAMKALYSPIGLIVGAITALVGLFRSLNDEWAETESHAERMERAAPYIQREAEFEAERQRRYDEAVAEAQKIAESLPLEDALAKIRMSQQVAVGYANALARTGTPLTDENNWLTDAGKDFEYYLATAAGFESVFHKLIDDNEKAQQAAAKAAAEEKKRLESLGIIGRLERDIAEIEANIPFLKTEEAIAEANDRLKELNAELERYKQLTNEVERQIVKAEPIAQKPLDWNVSVAPVKSMPLEEWTVFVTDEAKKMAELVAELNGIVNAAFVNIAEGIGNAIEGLVAGEPFNPLISILEVIGNALKQLGSALVAYAVAMEAFKKAFSNPWVALGAGVAAIAAGSAIVGWAKKLSQTPKLATGGLAYGPTMAVVGDNPGAVNDPEVIAPLSKLRNYFGGQRLQLVGDVSFELRGDVLQAVLNRNNIRLSTLG